MPVAGNIVANLTANTAGWTSGFASAMGPLTTMATAIGAFAAAGVVRFVQVGSALDDMSQRTGISAEALSRLQYAAQMTDATAEGLQAGLTKMAMFLDKVGEGSSGAEATLKRLGITTAELAGMSPDQQFSVFAEALSQIENTGQRAALAMQVFGKGAIEILPLLSEGADGIAKWAEEAERLGIVMSQNTANDAAALGDAFDRLILAGEMLGIKVGAVLAPILTQAANLMAFAAGSTDGWMQTIVLVGAAVAAFALTMKAITLATQAYTTTMAIAQAVTNPIGFVKVAAGIAAATVAVAVLNDQYKQINSEADAAAAAQAQLPPALDTTSSAAAAQEAALSKLATAQDALKRAYTETLPAGMQISKQIRDMERDWYAARDAGVELGITWDQLKTLQSQTVLDASGWQDMFTSVTEELAILRGDITKTEQQFQKMAEAGVPERQIEKLRQAVAERDKLAKAAELEKKSEDENKKRLESITSRVQDTTAAPLSQIVTGISEARSMPGDNSKLIDNQMMALQDSLAASVQGFRSLTTDVNDAVNAGKITSAQGAAFLADEQLRLETQIKKDLETGQPQQKAQALNEAMTVNSDAANRQLTSLLNRRGADSQVAKQIDLAKEAATHLAELKAIGQRQVDALVARDAPKSKPFGGRAS